MIGAGQSLHYSEAPLWLGSAENIFIDYTSRLAEMALSDHLVKLLSKWMKYQFNYNSKLLILALKQYQD